MIPTLQEVCPLGTYLANGAELYCFCGLDEAKERVYLEDCRTEKLIEVDLSEFSAMGLKKVPPR